MSTAPSWLANLYNSMRSSFEAGSVAHPDAQLMVGGTLMADVRAYCLVRFHPPECSRQYDLTGIPENDGPPVAHLFGTRVSVDKFSAAAQQAGAFLPMPAWTPSGYRGALIWSKLLPNRYAAAWIAFVYRQLRSRPGNVLRRASKQEKTDCDQIMTNPFTASLSAINWAMQEEERVKQGLLQTPRVSLDALTNTITIDGFPYKGLDPNGFAVVQALLRFKDEGAVQPIRANKLRPKLPGCNHSKTLERWIETLPEPVRKCIRSKRGAGRWFELPPRPAS
jgi:hypothetical protein